MHFPILRGTAALLASFFATELAQAKTTTPERVLEKRVGKAPYKFNGVVISGDSRGSGFRAWHPRTFFSAAHVVHGDAGWAPAPKWYPRANSQELDENTKIRSRGYVRWKSYSSYVRDNNGDGAFGKDIMLGYAFRSLDQGKPAIIDLTGGASLRKGANYMITGYPAKNAYIAEDIEGYFMHRTGPFDNPFRVMNDQALTTTLITTGPGNSGGPVWIRNSRKKWVAAGILTGGLPSETVVYGFSSKVNSLTRAVAPLVESPSEKSIVVEGVGGSSYFFPYSRRQVIPDGVLRWSNFRVEAGVFGRGTILKKAKLALDIRTPHRGDLQVMLVAPDGTSALIHNEEGANAKNLIERNLNLSKFFEGIDPYGGWVLRVQDRLKGDTCTLRSFRLELQVEDPETDGGTPVPGA